MGGLSWETDEDSLRRYFETIGTVLDCVIMRDRHTGHPRGFGFVTFADDDAAAAAASRRHDLDGRQVEAKRAVPRNEGGTSSGPSASSPSAHLNPNPSNSGNLSTGNLHSNVFGPGPRNAQSRYSDGPPGQSGGNRGHHTTRCKVFVGGLPSGCGVDEFRSYFSKYGEVADAQVMIDHNTGNSRGFGFVTFASEATVTEVVGPGKSNTDHEIMGKCVEVKRAEPKGPPSDRRNNRDSYNSGGSGGGGGGGGGMRGSNANNDQMPGNASSNGAGTNAAAAAAAAYYSNYPASLAEQYSAYYNNPQWQQYFAAMGYNFNAYPQGFNPYQQYLQAYMSNANPASGGNGASPGGTIPVNGANDGAAGAGGAAVAGKFLSHLSNANGLSDDDVGCYGYQMSLNHAISNMYVDDELLLSVSNLCAFFFNRDVTHAHAPTIDRRALRRRTGAIRRWCRRRSRRCRRLQQSKWAWKQRRRCRWWFATLLSTRRAVPPLPLRCNA